MVTSHVYTNELLRSCSVRQKVYISLQAILRMLLMDSHKINFPQAAYSEKLHYVWMTNMRPTLVIVKDQHLHSFRPTKYVYIFLNLWKLKITQSSDSQENCENPITIFKHQISRWRQSMYSSKINYCKYLNLSLRTHIFIYFLLYIYRIHTFGGVSWLSGLVHQTQVLVGSNPGYDTCVLEQDTYRCISSPRSKWVPVRAEMVLVIDLVWCSTYLAAQAVYSPGSWEGLRNNVNGPVTRGNNVGSTTIISLELR